MPFMDLPGFLEASGLSLYRVCEDSGIAYSTLHGYMKHGKQLGLDVAKRLESWSFAWAEKREAETAGMLAPRMLAAHVLGLRTTLDGPAQRRRRKAA